MANYLYNVGAYPRHSQQTSQQGITNHLLKNVEAYRRANPVRVPFGAGTPTLERRELDQRQSQFEQEYELALRKQEEEERQNRIANQLAQARLANEGSGSDGNMPLWEVESIGTTKMYDKAMAQYDKNLARGLDYPLYYTINSMLHDKSWIRDADEGMADRKRAIDMVLNSHGFSPEKYFNTPQGSKLKDAYVGLYKNADFDSSGNSGGYMTPEEIEQEMKNIGVTDISYSPSNLNYTGGDVSKSNLLYTGGKVNAKTLSFDGNLDSMISKTASEYGLPTNIFAALIKAESNGNQKAKSSAGAIGLTQLMPATARELGVNPYDTADNLRGGAKYLKQQYDKYGRWDLALAAYNAGPGNVNKYGGIPPFKETQNYVKRVLNYAGNVSAPTSPTYRNMI